MCPFVSSRGLLLAALLSIVAISGCGGDGGGSSTQTGSGGGTGGGGGEVPEPPVVPQLVAFDPEGKPEARIRWTTYGIPHIESDNLEGIGFGTGWAFARDNLCLLADQIIKYNSQRSRYFGADETEGTGDRGNLINDFAFLALGIREQAEAGYSGMSENARALISGYVKGYNRYLEDTGAENLDPRCAGEDWVRPITEIDLLTYSLGIALLPGAAQFVEAIYAAAPPGQSAEPVLAQVIPDGDGPLQQAVAAFAKRSTGQQRPLQIPRLNSREMASNGWAIGRDLTENGRGLVLGNPHFPHTGNLRFWQFHTYIPGVLNAMGGSLSGVPGVVNIGFNEHLAWTHTFSTAEHFVVYRLAVDATDSDHLDYQVDGARRTIEAQTFTIPVRVAPGVVVDYAKTLYTSDFGPVLSVPGTPLAWSDTQAFAIKDANRENFDIIDHWLAMNRAQDMDAFKQAFRDYDGMIFNNTLAADAEGNTFYIDDSAVPGLSGTALALRASSPWSEYRETAGFTILPAAATTDFQSPAAYEQAPKLENTTFVQNANDSYWLTHPDTPITGVSPLYGAVDTEQSYRTRMALTLLSDQDPTVGADGKLSLTEVVSAWSSQRAWLSESVLEDLIEQCQARGSDPVDIEFESGETLVSDSVDISPACAALAEFAEAGGRMTANAAGAVTFRVFAERFWQRDNADIWVNGFDPNDPTGTPNTLKAGDAVLECLAEALWYLDQAGIAPDATLGEVQFVERSNLDGSPGGVRIAWPGAHNIEGGFNVFAAAIENDGTLLPRHVYSPIDDSTDLSAEGAGYHVNYGSNWVYAVSFTEQGLVARGLLLTSQSGNPESPHFLDQTLRYAQEPGLPILPFTQAEILARQIETRLIRHVP